LSYKVRAPENFTGEITVTGTFSADGNELTIGGTNVIVFGTGPASRRVSVEMAGDRLEAILRGPLNAWVVVETAMELGGNPNWSLLTEFRLTQAGQRWLAPHGFQPQPSRFYRVTIREP
jgi:hypothetical protein